MSVKIVARCAAVATLVSLAVACGSESKVSGKAPVDPVKEDKMDQGKIDDGKQGQGKTDGKQDQGKNPGKEPPKQTPPKVEPPKAQPPKVEPPKQTPPKVEPPKGNPGQGQNQGQHQQGQHGQNQGQHGQNQGQHQQQGQHGQDQGQQQGQHGQNQGQHQQQGQHGQYPGQNQDGVIIGGPTGNLPITELEVCVVAEGNAQCTGVFGATGYTAASALNLGDNKSDLNNIGIRVMARHVPYQPVITGLQLGLDVEGSQKSFAQSFGFSDGAVFSTELMNGDNVRDLLSVGAVGAAFHNPGALGMSRINVCLVVEGKETCTGFISADGQYHSSQIICGDCQADINNVSLKFSTLSF